ncbi:hypothetical protein NQ166_02135 [Microbacterium sp. zg.Y1090]|uniref:hypothetical protein n=1 Tax=Microbacterium TaxID=33882 RepID=UPI00214A9BB9|nr:MULTISPECIES: hypothetical protein [unclassified Microbacterium]MCR2812574.1 hypothetical protein [Microbacterium sp. zg.Y1084]MCR2817625.1 hypothetical protein [Microbacterium sp. zg.Y1090]MDL5485732.1 hypothetical protein [Microbacterium sp. zg-Y1211]WIM28899.1 hypothetical protein QNO26_03080 [Microbacterium sp. zg-Y1090]
MVLPVLIMWWVFTGLFVVSLLSAPLGVGEERGCLQRHVGFSVDRSIIVEGSWELFPLGLTCSFTMPSGEQIVYGADPVPSVMLVTGVVLTVVGAVALIVSHRDPERQRRGRASSPSL